MRISYWSSDVCSSDLRGHRAWNPGLASPDAAIQPWTVAGEAGGRSFRPQPAITAPRRLVSSTAVESFPHEQGQWPPPKATETESRRKPPSENIQPWGPTRYTIKNEKKAQEGRR